MKSPEQKEIDKLFRAYDKARAALCVKRDELFPVGTLVRRQYSKSTVPVISGSLYAHQIVTDYGHMSWRYLERV
jgi:hypothetical protein